MFSCRLGSEQETALSILDPVNVQVELCGSPTYQSSSGLLDAFNVEDIPPLLEVRSEHSNKIRFVICNWRGCSGEVVSTIASQQKGVSMPVVCVCSFITFVYYFILYFHLSWILHAVLSGCCFFFHMSLI